MQSQTHDFADLVTGHQQRLYRYILSLLGEADAAWDVLQETNRVLLEKRRDFEIGTSFANWALTIAQYQTMAWLRDRRRDRLVATPQVVELLADDARKMDGDGESRQRALRDCLKSLPEDHRDLLHCRYALSQKLAEMSQQTGRSVNALKQLFYRLRETLSTCIRQKLQAE